MKFWPPDWVPPDWLPQGRLSPADPRLPDRPEPPAQSEGDYGPFKMGLQSYSLRGYTTGHADLKKALAATKELGVHYWEAFPAHVPLTVDRQKIRAVKDELEASGVHVDGWGVVDLGKDEAADRKIFEFARAMGLGYLTVDPDPDSFDLLDKLVEEYGIPIGIHNHGPGAPATPDRHDCQVNQGPQSQDRLLHRHGPLPALARKTRCGLWRFSASGSTGFI